MSDPTEVVRREMQQAINAVKGSREALESQHGQVWDTQEMQTDFNVEGFMAPCVVVRRKSDGVQGTMFFQHDPRFYFNFQKG